MKTDKHAGKCRSCHHYDAKKAQNKSGAFMAHAVAQCLWVPKEPIVMPLSVTWSVHDAIKMVNERPYVAFGFTAPNQTGCPCWETNEIT